MVAAQGGFTGGLEYLLKDGVAHNPQFSNVQFGHRNGRIGGVQDVDGVFGDTEQKALAGTFNHNHRRFLAHIAPANHLNRRLPACTPATGETLCAIHRSTMTTVRASPTRSTRRNAST